MEFVLGYLGARPPFTRVFRNLSGQAFFDFQCLQKEILNQVQDDKKHTLQSIFNAKNLSQN
jgi:hypothetical protein